MSQLVRIATLIVTIALGGMVSTARADNALPGRTVWGQPNLQSLTCAKRPGAGTLCGPTQTAVDRTGNLWVADFVNNRVLMYPPGHSVAARVLGQYGSFHTAGCNQRPPKGAHFPAVPSRYTLCQPIGLTVDEAGTLYVSEAVNNRVLIYFNAAHKRPSSPADLVIGQANFHSTSANDTPAGSSGAYSCDRPQPASRCTLRGPMELSLDGKGDLLVPDSGNNRVLLWSASILHHFERGACAHACFIPASRVWGQYGSFHSNVPNNPHRPDNAPTRCTDIVPYTAPASACTLSGPWSATVDPRGGLIVSDTQNNRLVEYDGGLQSDRQDATIVFGQGNSFITNRQNQEGLGPTSLWHPMNLAFDRDGTLWVVDHINDRVLGLTAPALQSPDAQASKVLGQHGAFATNACIGGPDGLCGPMGVTFDSNDDLYVSDTLHNRVIEITTGSTYQ